MSDKTNEFESGHKCTRCGEEHVNCCDFCTRTLEQGEGPEKYGIIGAHGVPLEDLGKMFANGGPIHAVQDGINKTLSQPQCEQCANYRTKLSAAEALIEKCADAIESSNAAVWDGHYSGKGVDVAYAQNVDRKAKDALSAISEWRKQK